MSNEKYHPGVNRNILAQCVVGLAGAVLFAIMWVVLPKPHPRSVLAANPENAPGIVGWQFRLMNLLGNHYVQLSFLIIFVCLAIFRPKDRRAWIYAFLAGWGFAGLAIVHLAKLFQ